MRSDEGARVVGVPEGGAQGGQHTINAVQAANLRQYMHQAWQYVQAGS